MLSRVIAVYFRIGTVLLLQAGLKQIFSFRNPIKKIAAIGVSVGVFFSFIAEFYPEPFFQYMNSFLALYLLDMVLAAVCEYISRCKYMYLSVMLSNNYIKLGYIIVIVLFGIWKTISSISSYFEYMIQ